MKVSVLINNFNYGRFLAEAIDSALAQTHRDVEVVVCDDGSTDESWAVIRRYGARVRSWRSPVNLGQASAMNAGMALCSGDWVLFLDSDDALEPDALARCVPLMAPEVAKIQFRLRCVDGLGGCLGRRIPYLMHDGDVRPLVGRFGTYAGPPSSGNLYRRSAIARYFPLDPDDWRRAADTPPFLLAAFHGRVISVTEALGRYRVHSAANRAQGCFGNIATRPAQMLRVDIHRRETTLVLLRRHHGVVLDGPFLPAPWMLHMRALSWRTEGPRHPYPDDSVAGLLRLQAASQAACPGYTAPERLAARLWLLAVLLLPRTVAVRLAIHDLSWNLRRWLARWRGAPAHGETGA